MKNILNAINQRFGLVLMVSAILGAILGLLLGDNVSVIQPFGTVFTRLLGMMVPVIVLFSISSAFANIGDVKKMSRWGGKVIGWFLVTTTIASILGIVTGLIFKPGKGISLDVESVKVESVSVDNFIDWIPQSFLGCIAESNTIQIVFLALFIGIAVVCMTDVMDSKKRITNFLNSGMDLVMQIVKGIMYYAPIGVVALTANAVSNLKGSFVSTMGSFLIAYTIAFVLQIVICYFGMLKFVGKVSPWVFTKKLFPALITAFTTTSSAGTLPITLRCAKDMGVNDEVADFGIPLGVTFNMDSMGVEIPLYVMLGMYAAGHTPSIGSIILLVVFGIDFSVGCAGVPGGGLAIATILVSAFNLPTEVVTWIAAIFFYLDVTGTPMNIWGDAVCSVIVARSEGLFDEEKFYS